MIMSHFRKVISGLHQTVTHWCLVGLRKIMNKLKFKSDEVSLLPDDRRRVVIDGILRDFFLSIDSSSTNYLICKDRPNDELRVYFTGTWDLSSILITSKRRQGSSILQDMRLSGVF